MTEAYLHARVPRVDCPEHATKQVKVPWARGRSDFTLLFEALMMAMVKQMPVAPLASTFAPSSCFASAERFQKSQSPKHSWAAKSVSKCSS